MDLKKHLRIFNGISPVYNLFFNYQFRGFQKAFEEHGHHLALPRGARILDIGCGTGALCSYLQSRGYEVYGIDMAEKMLDYARKRNVPCGQGNVVDGLDLEDQSFDLVCSSYVAHGLDSPKRRRLFEEARRLSRDKVLIHDYSDKRKWTISFIEYLEDGDYFNFIQSGISELKSLFKQVQVIPIKPHSNWHICSRD